MRLSDLDATLNDLSSDIIGAALDVHSGTGPGLLESAYVACLVYELRDRGLQVVTQLPMPVSYKGVKLDVGYRIDLVVNEAIVIEVKAVSKLLPVHEAQLLSYLRLGDFRLGLLFNFHVARLADGMRRLVNSVATPPPPGRS